MTCSINNTLILQQKLPPLTLSLSPHGWIFLCVSRAASPCTEISIQIFIPIYLVSNQNEKIAQSWVQFKIFKCGIGVKWLKNKNTVLKVFCFFFGCLLSIILMHTLPESTNKVEAHVLLNSVGHQSCRKDISHNHKLVLCASVSPYHVTWEQDGASYHCWALFVCSTDGFDSCCSWSFSFICALLSSVSS